MFQEMSSYSAVAVTAVLGIFHLIPLLILVWIVALAYIIIYQYRTPKNKEANFVCLDCATIHQQDSCPKCGSKLKKFYSRTNRLWRLSINSLPNHS